MTRCVRPPFQPAPQLLKSFSLFISAILLVTMAVSRSAMAAEPFPGRYSPDVGYDRGSLVIGSDGNVYRALDAMRAKDPVTATDAAWQLAQIAFDTTLDVPGRFETIEKAFSFIAGATISGTVTVTVQVAPGTYEMRGPLSIGHAQHRRVVLKGSKDPSRTVLNFGRGDGIVLDHAQHLRMEGLTLVGGKTGMLVDHSSSVSATNLVMKQFRISFLVENGSRLIAERLTVETDDGDWGVKITSTSQGILTGSTITRTTPSTSTKEHTFGVDAETGGSVACHDCRVSGWMTGIHAGRCGSVEMWGTTATKNVYGGGVYLAGSLSAFDCAFDGNLERGLHVHGGGGMLSNCQIRGNSKVGICSGANGIVDFLGIPNAVSDSEIGLHTFGGGRFHGVSPQFTGVERQKVSFPEGKGDESPFFLTR